ncbi:hypothetical protein LWI28_024149 [Acer negundo]|uniref:Uncharacterized protein n=1 Tax=Acer negundo TaxID=4023 RepID=A0AAD5J7R7_ACENE|nr:hypothetical protein LWI28_024149 [Acer negundo]KAK4856854.1 hypothetical protein QYF36_021958 [Acer negundo]
MGTQAQFLVQLSTAFTSPSLLNPDKTYNVTISHNIIRCRSSRSRSDTDPTSSPRFRFNQDREFYTDGDDYSKQRVWWSDYDDDDDDDDDDDWDVDEQDEFWIFKIFRAFGWMLPAIAVSSLLGTDVGPNAILMALAVPLGQSILSLMVDKVWGSTTSNSPKSRSKRKTKRKPFARAAANTKTRQSRRENEAGKTNESYEARNGKESYQSWVVADDAPPKKSEKTGPRFGGWDELDKKARNYKVPNRTPRVPKNELPKRQKGILSRTGRIRDKPLLLRLLIAVFPFLGSWTKLLF